MSISSDSDLNNTKDIINLIEVMYFGWNFSFSYGNLWWGLRTTGKLTKIKTRKFPSFMDINRKFARRIPKQFAALNRRFGCKGNKVLKVPS